MDVKEGLYDLVDDDDRRIGPASRRDCHGNLELIHRAVHVLLFNDRQQLLLQKRSDKKDIRSLRRGAFLRVAAGRAG